jgi:sugar lactone lactonase YvrE
MATLVWTNQLQGNGTTTLSGFKVGILGEICVCGSTTSASIGNEPANANNATTTTDGFLCKYDVSGNINLTTRIKGNGDDNANAITFTPGYIYVGGMTKSPRLQVGVNTLGNPATEPNGTTLSGPADAFLLKYTVFGQNVAIKRIAGTGIDSITSITPSPDGFSVYASGYTTSSNIVTNIVTNPASLGLEDGMILQYQQTGDVDITLSSSYRITGSARDRINASAYVSSSQVIFAGETFSTQITGETAPTTMQGNTHGFVLSYNPTTDSVSWVKRIGSNGLSTVNSTFYASGFIYVGGNTGSNSVGTESNVNNRFGSADGFAIVYTSDLGTPVFTFRIGAPTASTYITSVEYNSSYLYVAGYTNAQQLQYRVSNTSAFGETSATNSIGSMDGFFAKISNTGQLQWLQRLGTSGVATQINGIALNPKTSKLIVIGNQNAGGFVSAYEETITTVATTTTKIDYCLMPLNRRSRLSMNLCSDVQYNQLTTAGNDPKVSQRMLYSSYVRTRKASTYIYQAPVVVPSNSGLIITYAGGGETEIGSSGLTDPTTARFRNPTTCVLDASGNMYIGDNSNRVFKVTTAGVITTVAGSTVAGSTASSGSGYPGAYSGDGDSATSARLHFIQDIAIDSSGNLYIVDCNNHCIRYVSNNIITTICGKGTPGYFGDDGLATSATLNRPQGICLDKNNNIYIADTGNNVIRKISKTDGKITTIAGSERPIPNQTLGDGESATSEYVILRGPRSVYVDNTDVIYIADTGNRKIRKITTGIINTVAGTGNSGYNGDNLAPIATNFNMPVYVTMDSAKNLYVSDFGYNRVRKINTAFTTTTTIAGNGDLSYEGDGILATSTAIHQPRGLSIDSLGNIYVADMLNLRIRKIYA